MQQLGATPARPTRAMPSKRYLPAPQTAVVASAVAVFTFLYLAAGLQYGIPNLFDEPYSLFAAVRLLEGETLYKTLAYPYPPGEAYFLAGIFRLFGPSLLAERIFGAAVDAAVATCLYVIARRAMPALWAVIPVILFALWRGGSFLPGDYQAGKSLPLLFGLLALLALLRAMRAPSTAAAMSSGALAGTGILFRLDTGAALAAGLGITLLLSLALDRALPLPDRVLLLLRYLLLPYVGGVLLIVAFFCLVIDRTSGLRDAFYEVVFLPYFISHYTDVSSPMISDLQGLLAGKLSLLDYVGHLYSTNYLYLSSGVCLAAIVWCVRQAARRPLGGLSPAMLGLTTLGVTLLLGSLWRPDAAHFVPTMAIALSLLVWIGHEARSASLGRRPARLLPAAMLWLVVPAVLIFAIGPQRSRLGVVRAEVGSPPVEMIPIDLPRAYGLYANRTYVVALTQAVRYVQQATDGNERILVANRHHRSAIGNDVMFYFLSQRPSATRYFGFEPGFTTRRDVQEQMMAELDGGVRFVVINTSQGLTRQEERSAGSSVLDDYLATRYEPVAEFDMYRILRRIGLPTY